MFSQQKKCEICGHPLPDDYRFDVCSKCEDIDLFDQVRSYIRDHDVNELQVAEHFKISRRKVHSWIRQGLIQYKDVDNSFTMLRCKHCGKTIAFGEYCTECVGAGGGKLYYK